MTTSKVLAALLALCVAQNAVYGNSIHIDQPSKESHTNVALSSSDGPSYWEWMGAMMPLSTIIYDIKNVVGEYNRMKTTMNLDKAKCNKLTDELAKEQCLNDVDEKAEKDTEKIIEKVEDIFSRLYEVLKKIKDFIGN